MKRYKIYLLIIVAVLAVVFFALRIVEKKKLRSAESEEKKAIPVTVSDVIQHEFQGQIEAVSTLDAKKVGIVSPKVPGTVAEVLVDIGDTVEANQVLIKLDRTNFKLGVKQVTAAYKTAISAVSQVNAQYEQAKKEYNRASILLDKDAIARSHFDAAEAGYKTAKAALGSVRQQRNQAKAALETAKQHLKDADIRSPISGIVVYRQVEVGQSVGPGAPLMRVVDQVFLKTDVDLPEADFTRVAVGTPTIITVDVLPDQKFHGKVEIINQMVNRMTRTFSVRIEISNPDGKLVDGMFARVKLLTEKKTGLAIPRSALQRLPGSGTYYVFVVEKGKTFKRTIKVGTITDQYTEVLDGLTEGGKVVTSGTGKLRSGIEVVVSKGILDKTKTVDEGENK